MSDRLCISFRFLSPEFHGRGDEGKPEWPPSPLRVFQALVAASARAGTLGDTRKALEWLESLPAPEILAPRASLSKTGYRLSVPHNAMDLVARQWVAGKEGGASEHRTMKNVRPHRLPEGAALHYLWQWSEAEAAQARSASEKLTAAARAVVALGWGVDLVVGDGALISASEAARLATPVEGTPPESWRALERGPVGLRTPTTGSLADLDRRHEAFSRRTALGEETLTPPPAVSVFKVLAYGRSSDTQRRRVAAFTLMDPQADRMRAFDTPRRAMAVAGMLRHAVRLAAERSGWSADRVRGVVLGHGETAGEAHQAPAGPRLLLMPVPSIERRGSSEAASGVRRVLIASTLAEGPEVSWAIGSVSGADLIDEKTGEVVAILAEASPREPTFERYVGRSTRWVSVTPVVLPGHDDPGGVTAKLKTVRDPAQQRALLERLARRREALIRKALRQSGLPDELAFTATIEARSTGFLAGVERADRYAVPQHLRDAPRLHVSLTWPHEVSGPICIGRGRFSGMGLFAAVD